MTRVILLLSSAVNVTSLSRKQAKKCASKNGGLELDNKKRKLNDIAVCPLCGEFDSIWVTDKDNYDHNYKQNNGACVGINCVRCGLELYAYSVEHEHNSYEYIRSQASHKWNRLSDKIWKDKGNG